MSRWMARASKHKAMRYERMKQREAELKAEVARMLAAAEAADCEEDETFGQDKRGDEMPDWAGDKQKRLGEIQHGGGGPGGGGRLGGGGGRRRQSAAASPKGNSSPKPKAARSRANRRRRHRTNLIQVATQLHRSGK